MSRLLTRDRRLIALSLLWLGGLLLWPTLLQSEAAFYLSLGLIALNASHSLFTLTRKRQVLIGLNGVQILLFGLLSAQLDASFGAEHYRCDHAPRLLDWIGFTAAHLLRAADLLDALEEYGISLQSLHHASVSAGCILLGMHLTVDVFLIGLAQRWLSRLWGEAPRETWLARERREFGWLLATLVLFVSFALVQGLSALDWLLWPLDQVLHLLDLGDAMQIFGWQLHSVEANAWTSTAGLLFRLAAGLWLARLVIYLRLTLLRTWGLSHDELIELLDDPDSQVRRRAASGLGRGGAAAQDAIPPLMAALHDLDPGVRAAAACALGHIGPAACDAIPCLMDAVWSSHAELSRAAVAALGKIGPSACAAVPILLTLCKVADPATIKIVKRALRKITTAERAGLADKVSARPAAGAPLSKRGNAWERSTSAARSRHKQEIELRTRIVALLEEGIFAQEQEVETLQATLGQETPALPLHMPLLLLVAEGRLCRRKNDHGRWVYQAPA